MSWRYTREGPHAGGDRWNCRPPGVNLGLTFAAKHDPTLMALRRAGIRKKSSRSPAPTPARRPAGTSSPGDVVRRCDGSPHRGVCAGANAQLRQPADRRGGGADGSCQRCSQPAPLSVRGAGAPEQEGQSTPALRRLPTVNLSGIKGLVKLNGGERPVRYPIMPGRATGSSHRNRRHTPATVSSAPLRVHLAGDQRIARATRPPPPPRPRGRTPPPRP